MTYKSLSLLLFVAVVGLSVALWMALIKVCPDKPTNNPSDSVRIIRKTRDSLNRVILATQDTLNSTRQDLDCKMRELAKARLNTMKSTKQHEAIHFVPLTDSARMRELARLYPSYKVP